MGVAGEWNNAVGKFRGRVRSLLGNAPYYSQSARFFFEERRDLGSQKAPLPVNGEGLGVGFEPPINSPTVSWNNITSAGIGFVSIAL